MIKAAVRHGGYFFSSCKGDVDFSSAEVIEV